MKTIQVQNLSVDELRSMILETTESVIQRRFPEKPKEIRKLTKKQAARILGRTLTSIDTYCKKGILNRIRIGGRVYFNEDEVYRLRDGGQK